MNVSDVDAGLGQATAARRRLTARIAGGVAAVAITAGILTAPGFDEQEVRADDPAVWALQTGVGERFARVNTAVSELDTVKGVSRPSEIIQHGGRVLVYSDNLRSVTPLDAAKPHDVGEGSAEVTMLTPVGTESVMHAGDYVSYLTETGRVFAGAISSGSAVSPLEIDPYADVEVAEGADRPQFRASAVAVSSEGMVVAYSSDDGRLVVADAETGALRESIVLPDGPATPGVQVSWAADEWLLLEPDTGLLWRATAEEPTATSAAASARLQQPAVSDARVVIADEFGVVVVNPEESPRRAHGSDELSLGVPAAPTELPDGSAMAVAWLPAGEGPGTLWLSTGAVSSLSYGELSIGDRQVPQLRSNGARLILNEIRSGWVWTIPTGELVPSSQEWEPELDVEVAADDVEVATQISEPRPPVARDDAFGVRAGRQVALPVLLNDHDANEDVLTVAAGTVTGLDPTFGTASIAENDQAIVVDVAPDAHGTATFTYVVTDGTTSDGLLSAPATVTLRVVDEDSNSDPVWCGVEDCLASWPSPQVSHGGTVTADVLSGWVDPDGDPLYVLSATTESTAGIVAASPEGQVVFQHSNASTTESGTVAIDVEVADARGATTTRTLNVTVLGEPELRVSDVATTTTAGVAATVDIADKVTGARGPLEVTEAALRVDDEATVEAIHGLTGFRFVTTEPGSYLVDFTVSDGMSEARGTARITVIPPEDERLTTVPVTAFVRSREDVTVDVLSTVTNPGRHVLLLSDLSVEPAPGAQLSADVVGHSALRLSGETADGQPGLLGVVSYTASDGSGREEATVRGEVTLMLLESNVPSTPLAVDDAMTVRVGTQTDIRVLANDMGPAGNVIALDADSVESGDGTGLAFAAGPIIRYLAPEQPGVYEIEYAAYVLGHPSRRDTATVVVTVLDSDTNEPPTPRVLRGRVASGETVRLPFDGTGIDPDGDAVVLRRIETQPHSGSAVIAADGQSIIYSADPGFAGQASFSFSVVDARGQWAVATAHVGVLDADADPRPVTYTDYVQAQAGPDRRVVVDPLANDLDLAGGELEFTEVRPDAHPDSVEYADLDRKVLSVEDGRVELSVGENPGTYSYVYSVRNAAGSTAIGRIILKAVREPVADVPIIADTVLTAENRETFVTGVDVLTDKVSWGAGSASDLELQLWGDQEDLRVSGRSIAGPLPEEGRLVPFQVSGPDFTGELVVSYGFLRIPGENDFRIGLREGFEPPEVNEGESVTFDLARLIAVPAGVTVSVEPQQVSASGARPGSTCEAVVGTQLRYTAAEGSPYTDTCRVSVRVSGQDEPTLLPVPIVIIPAAPVPILTGASLAVSPGDSVTFDLAGMVSWPAGATGRAVEIAMQHRSSQFDVQRTGTVLTVTAADAASPGSLESATVSLPSDPSVSAVSLALTVGPAPSTLPKGASVVQRCSQSSGSSCTITVIGGSGEVNPLPGTPLELIAVSNATCTGVEFSVASPRAVRATWTADAPGAVCDTVFEVRDAQGRVSSGDRIGSLSLDLQGYPAAPSEVRQVGFGDGTVTFAVTPGPASASYPAISGFTVHDGSRVVATCSPRGECPQVTGLTNGQQRQYTARAVNAVGDSRAGVTTTAWAYAPPAAPTNVRWTPSRRTQGEGLHVDLQMTIGDRSTAEVLITADGGEQRTVRVNRTGTLSVDRYRVGSNAPREIVITPLTSFDLPPIEGARADGATVTVMANGVGKPTITSVEHTLNETRDRATLTVQTSSGGAGSETWVGIHRGGQCRDMVRVTGGSAQLTTEVTPNRITEVTVCGESRYDGTAYAEADRVTHPILSFRDPGAPHVNDGYRVRDTCQNTSWGCEAQLFQHPSITTTPGAYVQYSINGGNWTPSFSLPTGTRSTVLARQCFDIGGQRFCSEAPHATVGPRAGSPAYPVQVQVEQCTAGTAPQAQVAANGNDYALTVTMRDENGDTTTNVEAMRSIHVSVQFQDQLAPLGTWQTTRTCAYTPPPDPEPEPEP